MAHMYRYIYIYICLTATWIMKYPTCLKLDQIPPALRSTSHARIRKLFARSGCLAAAKTAAQHQHFLLPSWDDAPITRLRVYRFIVQCKRSLWKSTITSPQNTLKVTEKSDVGFGQINLVLWYPKLTNVPVCKL